MNKKELEKMFDEFYEHKEDRRRIKDFIFNEIIPEVIKSIMPVRRYYSDGMEGDPIGELKQNALELYNIDL